MLLLNIGISFIQLSTPLPTRVWHSSRSSLDYASQSDYWEAISLKAANKIWTDGRLLGPHTITFPTGAPGTTLLLKSKICLSWILFRHYICCASSCWDSLLTRESKLNPPLSPRYHHCFILLLAAATHMVAHFTSWIASVSRRQCFETPANEPQVQRRIEYIIAICLSPTPNIPTWSLISWLTINASFISVYPFPSRAIK